MSIVETCYQLSSRKVDAQSMINWAVVGQLIGLAKFHYMGPTRQSPRNLSGRVGSGQVGSGRARVVEFSYKSIIPPSSDAPPL